MPFLSPKDRTNPEVAPALPWPINGLVYVVMFTVPTGAGAIVGAIVQNLNIALLGGLIGIGITFLNGWLCDRFLKPWVARHKHQLQSGAAHILLNLVAFAWAIALCALSMIAPFALVGSATLSHIR